jgi:type IV pilus assembly protein PilY1
MRISNPRAAAMAAGLAWALTSGSAALADDTELFFVDPSTITAQPNILFILDNSGSMNDLVESQAPYDPTAIYPAAGGCGTNRLYWTTSGGIAPSPPDCSSSDNWFDKSSLVCRFALEQFAAGAPFVRTSYQQYNPSVTGSDPRKWLALSAAQKTRDVECKDDRGIHGDGAAAALYARNGAASPWGNADTEIGWSVAKTALFDGNYLNWFYGPTAPQQKIAILKAVATNVLNSIDGVNVGLMTYNAADGGNVRYAMEDIATARASIVAAVNGVGLQQFTPLSETLHEAHRYLSGGHVGYGDVGPLSSVDASRTAVGGGDYKSPLEEGCQKNFIVYLSDGLPTNDTGSDAEIATLVGGTCDGIVGDGYCLDDLAGYLHEQDIDSSVAGEQHVTTYTIGFDADIPLLQETAKDGGGAYFTAADAGSLTMALTTILSDISTTSSTFPARAVSMRSFNRTRHLNDLFVGVFSPTGDTHWPGNLKKYRLRPSDGTILDSLAQPAVDASGAFAAGTQSFWSAVADGADAELGGAASNLPLPAARAVYTYVAGGDLNAAGNLIVQPNTALDDAMLNTGQAGRPTRSQIIDFIRGADPVTGTPRYQMGDPLHSEAASVTYGAAKTVIYLVTNDGYLHALDAGTGKEDWAFVPPEFLDDQVDLYLNGPADTRHYGIDGAARIQMVADDDGVIAAGEKVYLYFGMRRGGDFYYGLDVTNPADPKVLWRLPGTGAQALPGMGQSWSNPMPARMSVAGVSQNPANLVLVFGAGYDTKHDEHGMAGTDSAGKGIFIVDSVSGNVLWSGAPSGGTRNFADMSYAIAGEIRVVDLDSDGYGDRMYAADLGGQVWRFDVFNGQAAASLVTGGVIARLGGAPAAHPPLADTRRFYNAPDVAVVSGDVPYMHIGIGSGHRERPNSSLNTDRFFALRDYAAFATKTQAQHDAFAPITDADLVDVTTDANATIPAASPGWKLTLTDPGEKVLAEARTFNNAIFFTSFTPGGNATDCKPALGTHRLYTVGVLDGAPVSNLDNSASSGPLTVADRSREFAGSVASEVLFIFPSPEGPCVGEQCTPPPIACVNLFCFPPGFANNPVRTFWSQENLE